MYIVYFTNLDYPASLCHDGIGTLGLLVQDLLIAQGCTPYRSQRILELHEEARNLILGADGDSQAAQTAHLIATKSHDDALARRHDLVDLDGDGATRPGLDVEQLDEQEVTLPTAAKAPDTRDLGQLCEESISLAQNLFPIASHDAETLVAQSLAGQHARRLGHIIRSLESIHELCNGRTGKGDTAANARTAKAFTERLHDDEVWVFQHPLGETVDSRIGRKVNVRFVEHDDAIPRRVSQHLGNLRWGNQCRRRIARRADEDGLDGSRVGARQRRQDGRHVQIKGRRCAQWDLDEANIVNRRTHGIHAVRRRTHEDAVAPGHAEAAHDVIDRFVAAGADKEVGGCQRLRTVCVCVA